ncbi:MAG: hypothetical protein KIT25_06565 [Enhydrobacter sp.]|nr:MAG: hypothetical protein KIT25_06565 [Enhydrobacter sp.]
MSKTISAGTADAEMPENGTTKTETPRAETPRAETTEKRGPGRPRGSLGLPTIIRRFVNQGMIDRAIEILNTALEEGSETAARFLIRQVCGQPRGAVVELDLPSTRTAAGVDEAQQRVLEALADGRLAVGDAERVFGLLELRRRSIETRDLERRVKKAAKAQKKNEAFSDALNRTADGEASSEKLERLEEEAKPDLDDETRYGEIGDRFFAEATPERAERVREAARGVMKEQQQEREAAPAATPASARPAPDAPPPSSS